MMTNPLSTVMLRAYVLIGDERIRQVTAEGWTPEHDDQHTSGELLLAARCYYSRANLSGAAMSNRARSDGSYVMVPDNWPWSPDWWKPGGQMRDAVKAGALAWAEMSRMERLGEHDAEAAELLYLCADLLAACLVEEASRSSRGAGR